MVIALALVETSFSRSEASQGVGGAGPSNGSDRSMRRYGEQCNGRYNRLERWGVRHQIGACHRAVDSGGVAEGDKGQSRCEDAGRGG